MIPNNWHKEYSFNCLSDEDFIIFQSRYNEGDELPLDDNYCECEGFTLDGYHRCNCGNRRCYIQCETDLKNNKYFYVKVS